MMMKAVIFKSHGDLDVLEYADVLVPEILADEVLVRVKACSINHLDIWVRQGIPSYKINLPHISGCDVSGVVERVGPSVSSIRVGDSVIISPGLSCFECESCRAGYDNRCDTYGIFGAKTDGGYAQLAKAKSKDIIPMPGVSFEEAAAFPLVFLTAWHMLITRSGLKQGENILVQSAGSGIGHAAIQIAKLTGARVYATVGSDSKEAKAKSLGAEEVINYQREDVCRRVQELTGNKGLDLVFEHVGPRTWESSLKSLKKGGRIITCGATTGPSVDLDLRYVFSRELSILGSMMGTRQDLLSVTELIGKRLLRPVVDTVYPLSKARVAQERLLKRDFFGKLVLVPDELLR